MNLAYPIYQNLSYDSSSEIAKSLFSIHLIKNARGNFPNEIIAKEINIHGMADAEIKGLLELKNSGANVPEVYGIYKKGNIEFILMEYLPFNSKQTSEMIKNNLLQLYMNNKNEKSSKWGFYENNFIGTIIQYNKFYDNFTDYWMESRILPLVNILSENKFSFSKNKIKFIKRIENAINMWELNIYQPKLIHGDLWNGNLLFSGEKNYFIDPSVSYGNPEQDLAMLDLFGSPLNHADRAKILEKINQSDSYPERIGFWKIYPLLIHLVLFGESYLGSLSSAWSTLPLE